MAAGRLLKKAHLRCKLRDGKGHHIQAVRSTPYQPCFRASEPFGRLLSAARKWYVSGLNRQGVPSPLTSGVQRKAFQQTQIPQQGTGQIFIANVAGAKKRVPRILFILADFIRAHRHTQRAHQR